MTKTILYLPKSSFATLNGINSLALIFGSGWNSFDNFSYISRENIFDVPKDQFCDVKNKYEQKLMELIQQVAYVAIGVLTALSVFFGYVVAPFTMTTLSVITVVFTIMPFYHERLGTPRKSN